MIAYHASQSEMNATLATYTRIDDGQVTTYVETERLVAAMARLGWTCGGNMAHPTVEEPAYDDEDALEAEVGYSALCSIVPDIAPDDVPSGTELETMDYWPSISSGFVVSRDLHAALWAATP